MHTVREPHTTSSGLVVHASVVTTTVDPHALAALVSDPAAGAVAVFSGIIRDHDHGKSVVGIDYTAHPTAEQVLANVAADIAARYPVTTVAVSHRIGRLEVGEVALVAAVASAHRREAFDAVSDLVDEVKARLPVWKHQFFADGRDEWVNCP